jgi:hypothetical protein
MKKRKVKYEEPPVRFDPALRKYVPDLPQKSSGNKPYGEKDGLIVILVVICVVLALVVLFYYASKSGVYS